MDPKLSVGLVPPSIKNLSCSQTRLISTYVNHIGPSDVFQAFFIVLITFAIIASNLMVLLVINSRKYSMYIHPQPRYLITSLALNDLAIGLLIGPCILPALFHCWPYGEIFCQIQALLRGALSQQSAVILVCMAVDRYLCAMHPSRYHAHSSKKGCVAIISLTWILCLTFFGLLVLPKGYYFNATGLLACEPFYSKASYRILSSCTLYFPTTMILMYCYGSSFHAASRLKFSNSTSNESPMSEKMIEQYRKLNGSTSRSCAAISLGFIVIVTPWTIQEVVAACTGSKVPPALDFFVTWLALSNSFWNPFLYWLLNAHFRSICKDTLSSRCLQRDFNDLKSQCSYNFECDHLTTLPLPPVPPKLRPSRTDIDGLSEKYWGEILERTLSSSSLNMLQRTYGYNGNNHGSSSISKIYLTNTNSDINLNTYNNDRHVEKYLSNSEPKLCEHDLHDINCAKNKAFFDENFYNNKFDGLPNI